MTGARPSIPQRHRRPARGRERGAVLLALMLVLIVGSSYMLVSRLNEYAQAYKRLSKTQQALDDAKQALLNYAMNYPELNDKPDRGPGYLPCPDQDDDGATQSNCSESTGSALGRLPYTTLGLPPLTDSNGEKLWYAVSQNFKYNQSSNYVLNSDTPGTISVDAGTSSEDDDVVAVIIAPGEPVGSESGRRGTSEQAAIADSKIYVVADQYLEGDNATNGDQSYVTTSTSDDFNDQVITITRSEIMAAVQQRVLNEAKKVLASYYDQTGAYPWLAPFADPASDNHGLVGTHSGPGNSTTLQDTSVDFTQWGVAAGDTVWNLTDGSYGTVAGVTASTITLDVNGLMLGTEDDFDNGDEYYIDVKSRSYALGGTAATGSSSLTLVDAAKDFEELGVSPGDVIDNITDGSSGIVKTVDNDELTVSSLTGGTENDFDLNDAYRIRSSGSQATGGSATPPLTLVDSKVNFATMKVHVGDMVRDLTDGSYGVVSVVPDPSDPGYTCPGACNTLTLSTLDFGTNNFISSGDYYEIPRLNGTAATRKGLLPMHVPGESFATGFDLDWSVHSADGNTVSVVVAGTDTNYSNADAAINSGIERWVETSGSYSGTLSISSPDGECTWIAEQIADCRGISTDSSFLSVTASAVSGFTAGNKSVTNTAADFQQAGVKPGDKVSDLTNTLSGIVSRVYTSNPKRIRVRGISGYTAFDVAVGDNVRVSVATGAVTNTATSVDTTNNRVCASGADFSFVTPNVDVIRDNSNTSSSGQQYAVGLIVDKGVPTSDCVTYTSLAGGSTFTGGSDLVVGHSFTVLHNFIDRREYRFAGRISGTEVSMASNGVRERAVCLGYDDSTHAGADCGASGPSDPTVAVGNTATITIADYDSGSTLIGEATATVPATGTRQASLRIGGCGSATRDFVNYPDRDGCPTTATINAITYQISETADALPAWYWRNKWNRQVYAAYSASYEPGNPGSTCVANGNCLELSVSLPAGKTYDDTPAIVAIAGAQLDAQASSRTTGALNSYFEGDNAVYSDDLFKKGEITTTFNDQVRIVTQ